MALVVITACNLSGCSGRRGDESNRLSKRVVEYGQPVPKGGGIYKTGSAYRIKGRVYRPEEQPGYDNVGIASWYGDLFHGRYTANGEVFDMDRLSAAHPTLPLPVLAKVTNLANGRAIVVRVNDRGPYAHNRVIDLSRQSARALGFERKGTATVRVQLIDRAPMNGDDSYERRYLASQPWAQRSYAGLDLPKAEKNRRIASVQPVVRKVKVQPISMAGVAPAQPDFTASFPRKSMPEPFTVGTPDDSGEGDFYVQAASFKSRDNAERARDRLAAVGAVKIDAVNVGANVFYRVRVGPFEDRGEASRRLGPTRKSGFRGAKVQEN